MSEEITKGLTIKRFAQVGLPKEQDTEINGVVWFKEDSYKKYDKYFTYAFRSSSKKLTGKKGTPDFVVKCSDKNIVMVIECKDNIEKHQTFDNLNSYQKGIGGKDEISSYCINGALHYATFVNDIHDVIAVAISGTLEDNMRITSFVLPKGKGLEDIKLLEDGDFSNTLMNFDDYKKKIDEKLGRNQKENDKIFKELSSYASACSNYLRANGISAKDRAGFVSALVLALTNEDSSLYTLTEASIPDEDRKKNFKDKINKNAIKLLKESLEDIWENKDNLPKMKKDSLREYYNKILTKSLLDVPEGKSKYFKYGENILSSCLFSVYENIIIQWKNHTDLDIMGTFYTVFLKYASGDAKDKGIVLTPKHITELFCDIAEHYIGRKLDDTVKVLDITTGTGGYLIGALNRMDANISNLTICEQDKNIRKIKVREKCLIGVEKEPEMFALAYANMRFHGDGKSNLYACSSLLKHHAVVGRDENNNEITLKGELDKIKADVGMINPPYSLKSDKSKENKGEKSNGQSELDFIYSMLTYLKKGGIGIAIVPVSCASNKGSKLRSIILKEHTLLACMSMPKQLFKNSKVGTTTCIMVFKAHIPHNDSDKVVFLSRWLDDGFVTVPHSGRYDKNGTWLSTKSEWLRQLKGLAKPNDTVFMKKEIEIKDECLAEAYIKTDWSKISDKNFEEQLKKFSLYTHCYKNELEFNDKEMLFYLLDNLEEFQNKYKPPFSTEQSMNLDISKWELLNITKLFDLAKGVFYPVDSYGEGEMPLITASDTNNGIMKMTSLEKAFDGNCITIGKVGMSAFYQDRPFCCSHDVTVLKSKYKGFNKYIAMFLMGVMSMEKFRWDYGRQIQLNACKTVEIKIPVLYENENPKLDESGDYIPDYKYMEKYIKSLKYSKSI